MTPSPVLVLPSFHGVPAPELVTSECQRAPTQVPVSTRGPSVLSGGASRTTPLLRVVVVDVSFTGLRDFALWDGFSLNLL